MIRSGTGKSLSILDSNGITWHTISGYKIRENIVTNPSFKNTSGTVNVRTNFAPNPSFEATDGVVTTRTNLATNPSFELATGTVNVRTNLVPSPQCSSGWSNRWYGGGTSVAVYTYPAGGTPSGSPTYIRKTWTAGGGATNGDTGFDSGDRIPVTAGQTYTGSGWLRPSVGDKFGVATMYWFDAAGAQISRPSGATVALAADIWTRVSITIAAPANAVTGMLVVDIVALGALWAANDTLDMSGPLLEQSPLLGTYFDGSAPIKNLVGNPDLATDLSGWISGVPLSRVFENGKWWAVAATGTYTYVDVPLAVGGYYATSIRVSGPAGAIFSTAATDNIYGGFAFANTYTIPASGEIVVTEQSSNYSRGLGGNFGISNNSGVPLKVTEAYCEMVNGTGQSVTSPYYKGQGDFSYAWSGTANASTSVQQAAYVPAINSHNNATLYQSSIASHRGGKSLAVRQPSPIDGGAFVVTTVTAGVTYTASAWVYRAANESPDIYFSVYIGNVAFAGSGGAAIKIPANTWTRISATATATSTGAGSFYVATGYAGAHTFLVDDFLVEASSVMGEYFDGANPIRNLIANSSFEADTSGWTTANGSTIARDTSTSYTGTASAKLVQPTFAGQSGAAWDVQTVSGLPYTLSAWIKTTDAGIVALQTPSGAQSAKHTGSGNWERLSITWTATITGTSSGYIVTNNPTAGQTFWVDAVMVEQSSVLNTYYAGTGDFTYGWTGAANASTSVQQAPGVAAMASYWNAQQWNSYQSSSVTPVAGAKTWRLYAKDPSTFLYGTDSFHGTPVTPGQNVTISYYVRPSVDRNFAALAAWDGPATIPGNRTLCLAGVWTRVSMTCVVPTGATQLTVLFNTEDISSHGDYYDFDGLLIEKTNAVGSYFDGATIPAGEFSYIWTGAVNVGPSYQQAPGLPEWTVEPDVVFWKNTNGNAFLKNKADGGAANSVSFGFAPGVLKIGEYVTFVVKARAVGGTAKFIPWVWGDGYNPSATIGTDWVVLRNSVLITDNIANLSRLFLTIGAGQVEIEHILITTGTSYDDGYFDGSSPADEYFTYSWAGTPNASKSIATP